MVLKAYKELYKKEVFTLADLQEITKNYQVSKNTVHRLVKKGYAQRIKRGLYCIVPLETIGKDYTPDRILIATKLAKPGFLSHHTALELHGTANTVFSTVFITSDHYAPDLEYKGTLHKTVQTKHFFGITSKHYAHYMVKVSDKERTLLDCLRQPDYAGGFEEIIKSMASTPSLDYEKLCDYLKNFGEAALYTRTGYLLDLLKEDLRTPDHVLEEMKKHGTKHTYYLDTTKKKDCEYNKEWNLMTPKGIRELTRVA